MNEVVRTMLPRAVSMVAALMTMFLIAPLGLAEVEAADGARRSYHIVSLDPEEAPNSSRVIFEVVAYSFEVRKTTWEGREVILYLRDEVLSGGHQINWRVIMDPEDFSPIRVEKKTIRKDGAVISEEYENYQNHFYEYPPNTYHAITLSVVIRTMELAPEFETMVNIVVRPEMPPWKIALSVEDEDTVTVPAGDFECYKVQMEFDYAQFAGERVGKALKLMSALMPDVFLWVEKQAPHRLVKVEGAFGPPGSSTNKADELVKIQAAK